ncbi:sulfotransferase [Roseivivax marinus]|uniref:Sulfotransferase n=1 Tax=Roseivivax marinus TaxID=1379903 RepID=W4HMZ3_9RHOB|nr:sulfotransferase [Roseivivax marinus]ETW13476.1 sulfotransferase [Roseivivax marinus]
MRPAPAASPDARYAAALKRIEAGAFDAARTELTALRMERPKAAEIPYQLSRIAGFTGDPDRRAQEIDRALALKPDTPALIDAAIAAHTLLGDHDRVLALHDARIRITPKPLHARTDKALYLQQAGRFDEAEALLRGLIEKHPKEGTLYRVLFATIPVAADDPLMTRLTRLLADKGVSDNARLHAHYAMAKALEDQGRHDEIFAHLHAANRLQRAAAPYDREAQTREQAAWRAAQDGASLVPLGWSEAPRPVFVIGMPRSGTTLAERIIGAHPHARAGGELAHALRLVWDGFVKNGRVTPLASVPPQALKALGRTYRARLRHDTGADEGVATDKSIQSHLVMGYLAKALPDARFVAIRRDPRDVALSIYKNHFRTGTHRYSNDLADIAHAIKAHRASLDHWRDRLPERVTEVRYEDLVAEPEPTARRLVAAAGLDWDPACLDFRGTGGTVKTLSVAQVRQPIHSGRREAWRRHETDLSPFFDAWGDDPWD